MRDSTGGSIVGSCFIYQTDDEVEAKILLENDPYYSRDKFEVSRGLTGCLGKSVSASIMLRAVSQIKFI